MSPDEKDLAAKGSEKCVFVASFEQSIRPLELTFFFLLLLVHCSDTELWGHASDLDRRGGILISVFMSVALICFCFCEVTRTNFLQNDRFHKPRGKSHKYAMRMTAYDCVQ